MVSTEQVGGLVVLHAPWNGYSREMEPEFGRAAVWFSRTPSVVFAKYDASTHKWPRGFPYGSFPMIYLVPADKEAKPVRCNPNEDTDGKFIPAEHIVQFVDKAAYTLRGSFSRHHRETIELDSIDDD